MAINRRANPALRPAPSVQRGLEQRRQGAARRQNEQAVPFIVRGEITTSGTGEGSVTVAFPVRFYEKPAFSFGAEVTGGTVSAGSYPTISVVVFNWEYERALFSGAQLLIVVTGADDLEMNVLWSVTGGALRRPGGIDAAR